MSQEEAEPPSATRERDGAELRGREFLSIAAIDKNTKIHLGLFVGSVLAIAASFRQLGKWEGADTAWKTATSKQLLQIESSVDSKYERLRLDFERQLDEAYRDFQRRVGELESKTEGRWRDRDMVRFAARLRERNPTMDVPDPYVDEERR